MSSQLIIGDYGLSDDEERVQMGLWAMFASQLLMSVDLRTINNVSRALLLNERVIAINQDPLGAPGRHILSVSSYIYYSTPVLLLRSSMGYISWHSLN